jgi:hypothetical protein
MPIPAPKVTQVISTSLADFDPQTAGARAASPRPSPLEVLIARAEARALLWQLGELGLHDAVDELQAAGERDGLVAELGQDLLQGFMATAFAAMRDDLPTDELVPIDETFVETRRAADERRARAPPDARLGHLRARMADDVSLERAWRELNSAPCAAASTVEALMFSLRERGAAALSEADCRHRLADLSSVQIREVIARLMKLRSRYPAITDDLLFLLGEQMS